MQSSRLSAAVWGMALLLCAVAPGRAAETASTQPAHVDATNKDQVNSAVGGPAVVVTGIVTAAAWNGPGKMLVIKFKNGVDNFQVVAVAKLRGKLDKAFSSDVTMSIDQRKVEIAGNITRYAGKAAARKGKIELVITKPEQIKIVN